MRISRTARWMGLWALASLLASLVASPSAAQIRRPVDDAMIQSVMPAADSFSVKAGLPPVYTAYRTGSEGSPASLVGYVYLTANVPPTEYGYSGQIQVLVGMDLLGRITGARIVAYHESLISSRGDFLGRSTIEEQMLDKHFAESFQIGRDLDGVSGASISARAMTRGIRNSARRVARAYLAQPDRSGEAVNTGPIEDLTWLEMITRGFVRVLPIERFNTVGLELSFAFMGDETLGNLLVGPDRYRVARTRLPDLADDEHVMLLGTDGSNVGGFRTNALAVRQGGEVYRIPSRQIVFLGAPREGKAAGEIIYSLVMRIDGAVDLEQPFTIVYDDGTGVPSSTGYTVPAEVLASVRQRATAGESLAAEPVVEESAPAGSVASGAGAGAVPLEDVPGSAGGGPAATEPVSTDSATTEPVVVEAEPPEVSAPTPELTVPAGTSELAPEPAILDFDFSTLDDFEDETALSRLLLETQWSRVIRLVLLLGLVLYAFFKKSGRVGSITLGVTLVYLGFFDGGFLSVSHITSAIAVGPGVYLQDMALLFMVGFTVVTTLLWGRVFCGFLCPFGALQDFITRIVPRRLQLGLPQQIHDRAVYIKYAILLLIIGLAAAPAQIAVYQYFEPFGTVFYLSTSPLLWSIAGGFLVASAVVPRFYCRYACPLGAALGVASFLAIFRIRRVEQCSPCKVCEHACPTGAIRGPEIDFKECVRCNVCETKLLTKAGVCRHSMDFVRSRLVQLKTPAG